MTSTPYDSGVAWTVLVWNMGWAPAEHTDESQSRREHLDLSSTR
jgi:hypothetical protein